jgi:hypothetical protein
VKAVVFLVLVKKMIAVFILVIPGLVAAYGWTLMRESIFTSISYADEPFPLLKFLGGLILFGFGVAFVAGYFLRRDKRTKKPVMLKQRKKPE